MFAKFDVTTVAWAVTTTSVLVLVAVMVWRRFYRSHLLFFIYLILVLGQSLLAAEVYRTWGMESVLAFRVIWASQAILVCARGAAVFEIARQSLEEYAGIWKLARGLLLAVGGLGLGYSLLFSGHGLALRVTNAQRGMEMAVATVVVTLLLLVRYYGLPMSKASRTLCMGFCLYSCAYTINYSILQGSAARHADYWNFLNVLVYLATVFLWIKAVHGTRATEGAKSWAGAPQVISTEVSNRLRLLNDQLEQSSHRQQRS